MAQYKTPGVYIVEKNAFPNSVVEVATAVPAFIGHTETASYKGASLDHKPWRITSMAEYEACFGGAPRPVFTISAAQPNDQTDFRAVALPAADAPEPSAEAKAAADARTALASARAALLDATAEQSEAAEAAYTEALTAATTAATAAGEPLSADEALDAKAVIALPAADAKRKRAAADAAKAAMDGEQDPDAKKTKTAAHDAAETAAVAAEKKAATAAAEAARATSAARIKEERQRARADYHVELRPGTHMLYNSMKLFFQNGGGACYIVSVGNYTAPADKDVLAAGIETLLKEQEPTMLVIPEAVLLPAADCYSLQQQMLLHCGIKMKSRFALLDIHEGFRELQDQPVNHFRDAVTSTVLAFGAAYYPWVHTTIVGLNELNFSHLDPDPAQRKLLIDLLANELAPVLNPDGANASAELKKKNVRDLLDRLGAVWADDDAVKQKIAEDHNAIAALSKLYGEVMLSMQRKVNLLPPSAAMAGLYTMIDNTRGVWKAPANVGLMSVSAPAVNITHDDQEDLNVSTTGKSINAIRSFIGEGTLVWGARTLDGNSLDWRYVNVRRTMIMLEESLRLACKAYVFEPNVANTWVTIKSMARNFLTGIWKRGGLAGASPDDAFSVADGHDETMTADDILEGILRVTILVAISRPAEFIEITFQQQMQKS
jgi:phage tail sheath protein FI